MKILITFFLGCLLIVSISACKKEKIEQIEATGILKKQGATTYQYGTHTISNSSIFYALKSDTYNLDIYENQTITIIGEKISGYPFNGGPYYLNVVEVK